LNLQRNLAGPRLVPPPREGLISSRSGHMPESADWRRQNAAHGRGHPPHRLSIGRFRAAARAHGRFLEPCL